ncbi:MAG: hypothetical protein Kow0037_05150 [Calditrichia bacterium]
MQLLRKLVYYVMVGAFAISLVGATGCSRHPNPEQISKMEEARKACLDAEKKLNDKIQENKNLEQKLAQKKAELDELKKEKANIEQGLTNWSTQE